VRSTTVYCPFSPPVDPPDTVDQTHWELYDQDDLPMRTNNEFRANAKHIQETAHKEAADRTGIAGLAILARLPSIDFPRSFPPDSMHLFFENVIPALTRHYRGVFFKKDFTTDGATGGQDHGQTERPAPGRSRKRKRTTIGSGPMAIPEASSTTEPPGALGVGGVSHCLPLPAVKFKETSDPWNVKPKVWERIGLDQKVMTQVASSIFHFHFCHVT